MAWPQAIQQADEAILVAARHLPAWMQTSFYVLTVIGEGWPLLALIPFFFVARGRRFATGLLFSVSLTSGATTLLKNAFGRIRPCNALDWCSAVLVATPGGASFPSGHSSGSFAFAGFMAVWCRQWTSRRAAWGVTIATSVYAFLVASSRVVLGVHYPSDVLAGGMLGASLGVAGAMVAKNLGTKSPSPEEPSRPVIDDPS